MSSRSSSSNSGIGGGGGGGGGVVVGLQSSSSIPAGSRKMVQSLKEIVNNCPEAEIYSMLKECNMDPNEAVNRLLSQDPFHEVKSKRDKKKENKDVTELRSSRGPGGNLSRGGRSGTDRYAGYGGRSQYISSESGVLHSKPSYKKENGTNSYTTSASSAYGMAGNNTNWHPTAPSDSTITESKVSALGEVDGVSLVSQPSAAHQPAWTGIPGQKSMADIVKMGRPHVKSTSMLNSSQHTVNYQHGQAPSSTVLRHDMPSEDHAPKVSEIISEPVASGQQISSNDEWPLVEQAPAASLSSVLESLAESKVHSNSSTMSFDGNNQHQKSQIDDLQEADDGPSEHFNTIHGASSISSRTMQEENSGSASPFDSDLYRNMGSYQTYNNSFQHHEVEDDGGSMSEVSANMQQLSIQEEDQGLPAEVDGPSVVIPNHLQVQGADFSHLSFGSFGSGISAALSGPFASRPLKSNLDDASTNINASSVGHSDTRNPEYYVDESLPTTSDGDLVHRTGASAESDSPSGSQPEVLKQENSEATNDNQYCFPSSTPGYSFENAQQLNTGFHSQAYTNSLPSTLLAATVQPGRESDLPNSPFPMPQQLTTKYNTVSSINSAAISMSEALKTVGFPSAQPTAQTLSGAGVATGPPLPQAIPMHPYNQPTLPLGHFHSNMTYQYMPPSYTYMPPSAFQQAYAGNSMYHQSMLPQYKNSVSVSSLPQSAPVASGYTSFGNSTNIPGNFQMNPPSAPAGTATNYDDILSSQYKDSSHLIPIQQNDNSAMWLHGLVSRPMSAVQPSTYYSFQGQNQQPGGFRQGQQSSQNYGGLGYNFYHSQTGISLENQQQNPRDVSLGGSQGQPKQSQQIWQNGY